jgi:hypothetical protein
MIMTTQVIESRHLRAAVQLSAQKAKRKIRVGYNTSMWTVKSSRNIPQTAERTDEETEDGQRDTYATLSWLPFFFLAGT